MAALLICASSWTLHAAYSERAIRSGVPEDAVSACAADSGNSNCRYLQADILEQFGEDAGPVWRAAVTLNPRNVLAATRAGISAETRGDLTDAEQYYLSAERHNKLWLARWTLANYYLRRGDMGRFWHWMRLAFERSYGDRSIMFRAARQAGGSTSFLLREILPADREVLTAFLSFLLAEHDVDALPEATDHLLSQRWQRPSAARDEWNTNQALAAVDELLDAREPQRAIWVWNRLAETRLAPYPVWKAEAPLTNGHFESAPREQGLDWRLPKVEGVTSLWLKDAGTVKFSLSGQQPEAVELLFQPIPLKAGPEYVIRFQYRTQTVGRNSRVYWTLLGAVSPDLAEEDWTAGELRVPKAAVDRQGRLVLSVRRRRGERRPEGDVWVKDIRCTALP